MRRTAIPSLAAMLCLTACATDTKTPVEQADVAPPETTEPVTHTPSDPVATSVPSPAASSSSSVPEVVVIGTNDAALQVRYGRPRRFHSVQVEVTNTSLATLEVEVPPGLYLVNARSNEQNLVTVATVRSTLAAGETTSLTVDTACAIAGLRAPSKTTSFTLGVSPKPGVATFLRSYAVMETQVTRAFAAVSDGKTTMAVAESQSVTRQMIVWKWYGAEDDAIVDRLVEGYDIFGGNPAFARLYVSRTSAEFGRVAVLIDAQDTEGLTMYATEAALRLSREAVELGGAARATTEEAWEQRDAHRQQAADGLKQGLDAARDFWNR